MQAPFRFPLLAGVVLLFAAPIAFAESPLPDPVAPAVIGPPLDQIRPARKHHEHPAVKPTSRKERVAHSRLVHAQPHAPVAFAPTAVQAAPPAQPPTQVLGGVGQGARLASTPFGPGAYFSSSDHALVRSYYLAHPMSAQVAKWKIGEPIPQHSELTGVPDDLRGALSKLLPGHQYVEVDGDVVMVVVQSRVVVDGISRSMR